MKTKGFHCATGTEFFDSVYVKFCLPSVKGVIYFFGGVGGFSGQRSEENIRPQKRIVDRKVLIFLIYGRMA